MQRGSKFAVLLGSCVTLAGCHPYQRDPHYVRGRLIEIVTHPLSPDSLKYLLPALVFALFAGILLMAAWRRSGD